MKTNPSVTTCSLCRNPIPANGGVITTRGPMHLICRSRGTASVSALETDSNSVVIQGKDGPCVDSPCCGCCGTVPVHTVGIPGLLFEEPDRTDVSEPINLDEIPDGELEDYDLSPIQIPDGIDLTTCIAEIEAQLEARFRIESKTAGEMTVVICVEDGQLIARLFSLL